MLTRWQYSGPLWVFEVIEYWPYPVDRVIYGETGLVALIAHVECPHSLWIEEMP